MANGFTYSISADIALDKLSGKKKSVSEIVQKELLSFGVNTINDAKRLAPVDEGFLRNSIGFTPGELKITITVNADYAAYVEFGTRGFASNYVSTLPANWQSFAAQFKGKGGGDVWEMLRRLTEWVRRKGLAGTYSVKTKKRTGAKAGRYNEDFDVAYQIALSILRKGVKAHPFLYPAFEKNRIELIRNLKNQIEK